MPNLSLSVQFASKEDQLPSRSQFRKWVKAALRVDTEATVRIVDKKEGRALNLAYRGKDYATNVLTFPITEEPYLMGDIVICAQNKPREAHFAHLTVHGTLHLHGYDHLNDDQAGLMESIEVTTLMKLGYPSPYIIT